MLPVSLMTSLPAQESPRAEDLAEEWGWFPERAGLLAAESWGIKPQWLGKTVVESYQATAQYSALSPVVIAVADRSGSDEIQLPEPGNMPEIPQGFCEIIGEVSDEKLDPVVGAVVEIIGSGKTAETQSDGSFTFPAVASGNLTIEASKLGYSSDTQSATAIPGQKLTIRMMLKKKAADITEEETMLEEETVVGEYQETETGNSMMLNIQATPVVASSINKDDFSKVGASDAASAIGKVSGANIVGGKFAVVRGLADRYVTTQFNGAMISSADPSRKAVQLDIFPTNALQGIDVNKTYHPRLPGDFGGGTIRINSLNIPNERISEFKYKIGTNSNHGNRMLVHPNRGLGFWGDVNQSIPDSLMWNLDAEGKPVSFDAGGNRIVPGNTSNATFRQRQIDAARLQETKAQAHLKNQKALHASSDFMPKEAKPEMSESWSLVHGDRFSLDNGMEVGFIAAFQHATQDQVNPLTSENRLTSPSRSWLEERYSREVDWSFFIGSGVKLNEDHAINMTYFRKRNAADNISHGSKFSIDGDDRFGELAKNNATIATYGASAIYNKEFWTIDPVIRDTDITQISGNHKNDSGTRLNWSLTKSQSSESRPHSSTFQHGMLDFSNPMLATMAAEDSSIIYNPALGQVSLLQYQTFVNDGNGSLDSSRETQSIIEDSTEGSVDLTQFFYFSDDEEDGPKLEWNLGVNSLAKQREQQGRIYLMRTASWERWIARNPPSWWTSSAAAAPYSVGNVLSSTTLKDGSPLPTGFRNLGEYLAAYPSKIADYFNGYGAESTGAVPGTGTGSGRAVYVSPDAPYYVNGSGLEVRNVSSELTLQSFYTASTFHHDLWRFGGGARWEEEIKSYSVAADPLTRLLANDPSRFGSLTTRAFIPSVFSGIDIVPEKSWVNFAWSRTVARPTFHEFLPIESISQDTGIIRRGNPNLLETSIENLDASFDWVFSESLRGTASLFRKRLTGPIVVVQTVDQGQNSNTYVNGDNGLINGLELEMRWKPEQNPFSLSGNYTFIDSTLRYRVKQGLVVTPLETRFPFQPSQIFNLTLGFEPIDSDWSAFLTSNFTDEYPTVLRSEPFAYDVWLKPQLTLDLIVGRKIVFDDFSGKVSFGIKNLLETDQEFEHRGGNTSDTGPLNGLSYSVTSPGRTYSVEFKAEF
jgi:hypothetical protein